MTAIFGVPLVLLPCGVQGVRLTCRPSRALHPAILRPPEPKRLFFAAELPAPQFLLPSPRGEGQDEGRIRRTEHGTIPLTLSLPRAAGERECRSNRCGALDPATRHGESTADASPPQVFRLSIDTRKNVYVHRKASKSRPPVGRLLHNTNTGRRSTGKHHAPGGTVP